jgi:hypothetical protein
MGHDTTGGLLGVIPSYSSKDTTSLTIHSRGQDRLRVLAHHVCDAIQKTEVWRLLKDRAPDPSFIVDHLGNVKIRSPRTPEQEREWRHRNFGEG